jgi:hypothetical protein
LAQSEVWKGLILYSSEIFASATNLKNSLGVKTAVIFFVATSPWMG